MHHLHDATCLACGCLCDDIRLTVEANRIVRADHACPLGERWFLADRPSAGAPCQIDRRPATLDASLERAAEILTTARRPLVFGLSAATCEAQRTAVALADRLGACLDIASPAADALADASLSSGMVTATLGEVRHRADVVVFWSVDPATTHPRHFERYSLTCTGRFIPRGRADRHCVVVDELRTATSAAADDFYEIRPNANAAALTVLQTLASGEAEPDAARVLQETGVALTRWRELVDRIKAARYCAFFFQPRQATEALLALIRDMNRHARCVALPLGEAGNAAGAQQVLTWQAGVPLAVDFSDGMPRQQTSSAAAEALVAGRIDAALIVACNPLADPIAALPPAAQAQLATIPTIVLHTADCQLAHPPTIAIRVASPGIDAGGVVFRSDGVALPLRPATRASDPCAETVLRAVQRSLEPAEHAP